MYWPSSLLGFTSRILWNWRTITQLGNLPADAVLLHLCIREVCTTKLTRIFLYPSLGLPALSSLMRIGSFYFSLSLIHSYWVGPDWMEFGIKRTQQDGKCLLGKSNWVCYAMCAHSELCSCAFGHWRCHNLEQAMSFWLLWLNWETCIQYRDYGHNAFLTLAKLHPSWSK